MTQVVKARGPVSATAVRPTQKKKPFPVGLWRSAIGKKWVMALTGALLMGFVFAHMVGNLKMFLGKEPDGVWVIDRYGESLRTLLVPLLPRTVLLWILRLTLIGAGAAHVAAAASLTRMNHRARPIKYQSPRDYIAANFASRTMRVTGIIFVLFLGFHLADLTWGWFNPGFVRGAVHRNLHASLTRVPVAILYMAGNIALGIHLFHGAWSMFQSLGWNNPRFNAWRRNFAVGFATIVVVGNLSFPIAWVTGALKA